MGVLANGAIIPYASGTPVELTTVVGGLAETVGLVAFGSSAEGLILAGGTIDLGGGPSTLLNMAFSMPRDGVITSIAAFFSSVVEVEIPIGGTVTVTAQLYSAPPDSNIFAPIPGAVVVLEPAFMGLINVGGISSGITEGLAIPVAAETRLLMVFSIVTAGITVVTAVTGYASAGVNIE